MIRFEVVETFDSHETHAKRIQDYLNEGWSIAAHSVTGLPFTVPLSGRIASQVLYTTFLQRGVRSDVPHLPSVVETLSLRMDALRALVGALQQQVNALTPETDIQHPAEFHLIPSAAMLDLIQAEIASETVGG